MEEKIKKFIDDFYNYTITISITEIELFDKFGWLENTKHYLYNEETNYELYVKYVKEDMLYDLIYNQKGIENQFINDLCAYGVDSEEYKYIKEFYNEYKDMFKFEIDFTDYE